MKCRLVKLAYLLMLLLWSQACTAPPQVVMPDLAQTQAIRIRDDQTSFETVVRAQVYLQRAEQAFVGLAEFEASRLSEAPLTATQAITIPMDVMLSFFDKLSEAVIDNEAYQAPPTVTDRQSTLSINLTLLSLWSVEFYSDSPADRTLWRFETSSPDGLCAVDCQITSDAPSQALELLKPYFPWDAQDELLERLQQPSE